VVFVMWPEEAQAPQSTVHQPVRLVDLEVEVLVAWEALAAALLLALQTLVVVEGEHGMEVTALTAVLVSL